MWSNTIKHFCLFLVRHFDFKKYFGNNISVWYGIRKYYLPTSELLNSSEVMSKSERSKYDSSFFRNPRPSYDSSSFLRAEYLIDWIENWAQSVYSGSFKYLLLKLENPVNRYAATVQEVGFLCLACSNSINRYASFTYIYSGTDLAWRNTALETT